MAPSLFRKRSVRRTARRGVAGNLLSANAASIETDASGWGTTNFFGAYVASTPTQSAVRAQHGTKSLLITWPTGNSNAITTVTGLVIGAHLHVLCLRLCAGGVTRT